MAKPIKHICIDLELEQPHTNPQTPDSKTEQEEIIQVGWVVFEASPLRIIETHSHHVYYDQPLSAFIKKLTGISDEEVRLGLTLDYVYRLLLASAKKHETTRILRQWGGGDMECLKRELKRKHPEQAWGFGRSGFNVKHLYQAYAEAHDLKPSGGLVKSMRKCGVDWVTVPGYHGKKHDALVDAYNTAVFYSHLMDKLK